MIYRNKNVNLGSLQRDETYSQSQDQIVQHESPTKIYKPKKFRSNKIKKRKVTFKDQAGKGKIAKVYIVESYKKYNVETSNYT